MKHRYIFILLVAISFLSLAAESLNRPTISSSSFKTNAEGKFPATFAMDGKLESSWIEGTNSDGVGESLTIVYKSEIKFQTVAIYNGFGDPKKWANKNRIKKLKLSTDSGYEESFLLKDVLSAQKLNLKTETSAKTIKLTILEVFRGTESKETSIAEVKLLSDQAGIILSPPKNTWAIGKWKTESNIARISLHNDGTCEMGYETAKMLCTWTEKGDKVLVQLEATLPLTNSDRLELRFQKKNNEPTVEVNGKYTFIQNKEEV